MQFFGQFLIQEQAITVEQLREALDLMNRQNLMLGQLAVEEKFLSESQANQINREQRYTDRPFGSIAISQNLLDSTLVKRLLELQQEKRIRIGEALVQLGYLNEDDLGKHLGQFKAKQEPVEADRDAQHEPTPHGSDLSRRPGDEVVREPRKAVQADDPGGNEHP